MFRTGPERFPLGSNGGARLLIIQGRYRRSGGCLWNCIRRRGTEGQAPTKRTSRPLSTTPPLLSPAQTPAPSAAMPSAARRSYPPRRRSLPTPGIDVVSLIAGRLADCGRIHDGRRAVLGGVGALTADFRSDVLAQFADCLAVDFAPIRPLTVFEHSECVRDGSTILGIPKIVRSQPGDRLVIQLRNDARSHCQR